MARSARVVIAALMSFAALLCMAQGRPGNKTTAGLVASIPAVNTNGLVLWLRFDSNAVDAAETSTWTTNGTAVYSNDTLPRVAFVNRAATSLGSPRYYMATNYLAYSPGTNNLTLAAWIRPDSNGANRWIYGDYDAAYSGVVSAFFLASGAFQPFFRDGGGVNSVAPTSSTSCVAGKWYHVCGVKSGLTGSVYVNGILEQTVTNASLGNVDTATGRGPVIGAQAQLLNTNYFDGLIDDFRIYNRALSSNEIYCIGTTNKPRTGGLQ